MERLMARLDLTKLQQAPLDESEVYRFRKVKILLSQHIGAPAKRDRKIGRLKSAAVQMIT